MATVQIKPHNGSVVTRGRKILGGNSAFFRSSKLVLFESRPIVQGIFATRFLVGGMLVPKTVPLHLVGGVLGQGAWLAATCFVYLLNGISDVEGDQKNRSARPLASGRLSMRAAWTWVMVLGCVSMIVASFLSWVFLLCTVLLVILGWIYSIGRFPLKKWSWSSSATVGLAGFLTYVGGSLAYRHSLSPTLVAFAVIMSLWMVAAGNSKDFGDERGDSIAGRRSLPVVLGQKRAAIVVSIACSAVSILGGLLALSSDSLRPLLLLLPAALLMVLAWSRTTQADRKTERLPYRVFMLSQYVINGSMVLMALSG